MSYEINNLVNNYGGREDKTYHKPQKGKPKNIKILAKSISLKDTPLSNTTTIKKTKLSPPTPPPKLIHSIKLIDSKMNIFKDLEQYLVKNQHFTIIGIIGKKSVGKSTILSGLNDKNKKIFKTQKINHPTNIKDTNIGVDAYITPSRIILLDSQPINSVSIMKSTNRNKFLLPSIQIIIFLLSICHIIIFVSDSSIDYELLKIFKNALIIKKSAKFRIKNFLCESNPEILFVFNKIRKDCFSLITYLYYKELLENFFGEINLYCSGNFKNDFFKKSSNFKSKINLFLFPVFKFVNGIDNEFNNVMDEFVEKIYLLDKIKIEDNRMTEKTWFRMEWDIWKNLMIFGSQIMNDYKNLLL